MVAKKKTTNTKTTKKVTETKSVKPVRTASVKKKKKVNNNFFSRALDFLGL